MGESELVTKDEYAPIADDFLLQVAAQAERRIDAVIKIKQVALKVTNPRDWTDQGGNPYLQVSGSEKIANLFNISWRINPPEYIEEPDGHFTWSYKGEFSLGSRTVEVEGTRSSKDSFFNKYDYTKPKGADDKYPTLPPSVIDKGDVRKAALTNLLGNGITRILGIRNLTWDDLKAYADIDKESVGKVDYKKKSSVNQPGEKGATSSAKVEGDKVTGTVEDVTIKTGKGKNGDWTKYGIKVGGAFYGTFDKTMGEAAIALKGKEAVITFTNDGKYNTATAIEGKNGEAPTSTTSSGDPEGCTQSPSKCEHSVYLNAGEPDEKVSCGEFGPACKYKKAHAA